MTEQQVEWYLTRLKPELTREVVKEAHDDDLYQQASMDILRDCARYTVECERDFLKLFCRYYLTLRRQHRANEQRHMRECGMTRSLTEYCDEMGEYTMTAHAEDPRTDSTAISFEYIELLPNYYRDVFVGLFIEGLTQAELGERLGVTNQRVSQLVEEGVAIIQAELKQIEAL
jgi:RNA polymerase sigma factor (sigma-70 family)